MTAPDREAPSTSWSVWAWQAYRDGRLVEANPAAIREAALREAVEAIKEHPASRCCDKDVSIWFQNTILALIPKGTDHE